LSFGNEAWEKGANANLTPNTSTSDKQVSISGIGDNFDEEDDSLVFKSDMKVAELSDKALRSWVATHLLGSPSLGF
jgi:hypothetical protein